MDTNICIHACTKPSNTVHAADPTQETSGHYAECTALFIYFQQMLRQLFSPSAIYGPNPLSSNMHDVSIKDLMSPRLCLSGRIMWQQATMGKKTQIAQDKSGVCVSGSRFISGWSVLACVTRAAHRVLMELTLTTWCVMFWKVGVHREPELNQLGDTNALYLEVQHKVGGIQYIQKCECLCRGTVLFSSKEEEIKNIILSWDYYIIFLFRLRCSHVYLLQRSHYINKFILLLYYRSVRRKFDSSHTSFMKALLFLQLLVPGVKCIFPPKNVFSLVVCFRQVRTIFQLLWITFLSCLV